MKYWFSAAIMLFLLGCASTPAPKTAQVQGKLVCDSYLILDMCVRDLVGDGTVDMIYFSDSNEIFMYQQGRQNIVAQVMPFHRCAVPLNAGMQETTNRILHRTNMSLTEEIDVARALIANYVAAKPSIDACNAAFDDPVEEEFYMGDADWGDS